MDTASIDFISNQLEILSELIPKIGIRYEYDSTDKTHIIEVVPDELYKNDKKYINIEIHIEDSFKKEFPSEEILFISTESLTQIQNPTLILGCHLLNEFNFNEVDFTFGNAKSNTYNNSYALAA